MFILHRYVLRSWPLHGPGWVTLPLRIAYQLSQFVTSVWDKAAIQADKEHFSQLTVTQHFHRERWWCSQARPLANSTNSISHLDTAPLLAVISISRRAQVALKWSCERQLPAPPPPRLSIWGGARRDPRRSPPMSPPSNGRTPHLST